MRQLAGIRTTTPAALEGGDVLQETQCLRRSPAERVEDLAAVDHRLQPWAAFAGALDGHQQREEALAFPGAAIFLQSLAERQVLRLGGSRKARGVGREEGEGRLLVLAVLGEIEVDPADQVPGGMTALEEFLQRERGLGQLGVKRHIHAAPKTGEHLHRQIFRADHRRDRCGDPVELGRFGEHEAQAHHHGQHRGAAIRDERQRHAHDRHQPRHHGHIDEHIGEQAEPHAGSDQPRERAAASKRHVGDEHEREKIEREQRRRRRGTPSPRRTW